MINDCKKNVLMYTMHNPIPNGGGISRMAYNIGQLLRADGYLIYYISYNKSDSGIELENQYYFPSSNPSNPTNICYLRKFVETHHIGAIINYLSTNHLYTSLFIDNSWPNTLILSMVHNCVINHISNFAYQKQYSLQKRGRPWVFNVLRSRIIKQLIEYLCIIKYRRYYRKLENHSDYIILVSKSNLAEMNKMLGKKSAKLIGIPNFILEESICSCCKEKLVIWCGRIETQLKRADLMIDVWAQICHDHPDWKLIFMGDGEIEELTKYAHEKNAINFEFVGRVETTAYYNKASILCHTSISESFGLVIVEAMNKGIVPIAFNSFPSCQDIISDDCGFKISPFDTKEYASTLDYIMNNSTQRIEMSKMAINNAKKYSKEMALKNWKEILT